MKIRPLFLVGFVFLTLATAASAQQMRSGTLAVVWSDAETQQAKHAPPKFFLVDESGNAIELSLPEALLRELGGPLALNGKRVDVSVDAAAGSAVRSMRVRSPDFSGTAAGAPPQTGPKRYVTVLCQYADSAGTPRAKDYYTTLMNGTSYPAQDHYYREVSENAITMSADVYGWYKLPQPASYYYPSGRGDQPDLGRMINDCTTAADIDAFFPQYDGINMVFNGQNGGWSWGGGWYFTRDGQAKGYAVTWMASWATYHSIWAHELGHSLGWPHSSGPYGQVYDSRWDVMSGGNYHDPAIGMLVGNHTIAWHKELVGWIPPHRIITPATGSIARMRLERSAARSPGETPQMIKWMLPDGHFYTAEARLHSGYDDRRLPAEAIVLHRVDPRGGGARVVDVDNNQNPNDAAAAWTVGETFSDSINGVTLRVDSAYASGFAVTVVNGWRINAIANGKGRITASAPNIDCPGVCEAVLAIRGASVSLTAVPDPGENFLGWEGACTGTGSCSLVLNGNREVRATFGQPVAITSVTVRDAALGVPHSDTLRASGGGGVFRWKLTAGRLPGGVALDTMTGRIHGTPTEVGNFTFTARADAGYTSDQRQFSLAVPTPALLVATEARPNGTMGFQYTNQVALPYPAAAIFRVVDALPQGLSLAGNGIISGVPEITGSFTFTISATLHTHVATQRYSITVAKPALLSTAVMNELLGIATLTADEKRFLDLLGNRNNRFDIGDARAWLLAEGVIR